MHVKYFLLTLNIFAQALSGLERMQELVGKNLNNIVGNLWQRQENEGSGSSHGNIVSTTDTVQYSTVLKNMQCGVRCRMIFSLLRYR